MTHVLVSQVRDDFASPTRNTLYVTTTASIYCFFIFLFYTVGAAAKGPLQNYLNAETQDDEKLYEITLFSECAVIPFLQESYRLKYLSKMACSEANRWRFETHRRHKTISNNLAYVAHHKHAYILSTNREIERGGRRVRRFRSTKECKFQKYQPPEDRNRTGYRRERKILHDSKHLLNTYRTEKDRCKERETSDSYIQVTSKE